MCGYGHDIDTRTPEIIGENELLECNTGHSYDCSLNLCVKQIPHLENV